MSVLNVLINLAISCVWVFVVYDLGKDMVRRMFMPKHSKCGSRWHVRRAAYYWDVPLYTCTCEGKTFVRDGVANFFVANQDDGDRMMDLMLSDEQEEPLNAKTVWNHITQKPQVR